MSIALHFQEIRHGGLVVLKRKIRSLKIRAQASVLLSGLGVVFSFISLFIMAISSRNRARFLVKVGHSLDVVIDEIARIEKDELLLELEVLKRIDDPSASQVKRLSSLAVGREETDEYQRWMIDRYFKAGEFREANESAVRRLETVERESVGSGLANLGVRMLTNSFLGHIGHLTILEAVKKAEVLGQLSPERRILVVPEDLSSTANPELLRRWLDHFSHIKLSRDQFANSSSLFRPISEDVNYIKTSDGFEDFYSLSTRLNREWELKQIPNLMHLDEDDRADLQQLLDALGVNGCSWYVTLHVKHGNPYDSRGINIPKLSTYFEAIRMITSQGGFVVRMGDPTMTPLPRLDGIVDYAHSPLKSARNDILLFAGCRFGIGTASGPLGVPPLFGRPLLGTNYPTIGLSQYWPNVRMLPIWFKDKKGKRITFSTLSKSRASWALNRRVVESEFDVVQNSSEDLLAGVQEMMRMTENESQSSGDVLTGSQVVFEKLRREELGVDGMTISSSYVESHPEALR